MSPAAILKSVKERFPELKELPREKLRLVEEALKYASELTARYDLISSQEHEILMEQMRGVEGPSSSMSLRAYRYREDLTQAELAAKAGVPQANISAMENGKRPIGLAMAKKLAAVLNCDYKKLV